jgi:hypothetical protein
VFDALAPFLIFNDKENSMGWTFTHKPHGKKVRDAMRETFEQTYVPGSVAGRTILHDTATLREYFAIVERRDATTGEVLRFCLVVLIQHARGDYNFGYKEMTEGCGPTVIPPRSFFRALERMIPDPDGEWGAQWRDRCRAAYAARDAAKSYRPGQLIKLFGHRYRLAIDLKRKGFLADRLSCGRRLRITRAQLASATLVSPASPPGESAPTPVALCSSLSDAPDESARDLATAE